ncbi:hypothetical protein FRC04_002675 [Tulasnella sp. 424]|nr:hypothetical protein FRC04_002675 [Tulasnella sp. 424]KAG8974185.1 hypothetical protein FRC05_007761 [Tulasnella sp. 425]
MMDALPVELVSSIFHWVVHSTTPSSSPSPASLHRDAYKKALRLSHINQRLRDVAIGCPSLWTSVGITHDSHHQDSTTCLHRSKACPIDIHLDARRLPPQKVTTVAGDFAKHVERWFDAELNFEKTPADVTEDLVRLFDQAFATRPASALKSLQIVLPRSSGTSRVVSPPEAETLERLALKNLGLNWAKASFPSLKELRLTGINGPEAPSLHQFTVLLENAPNLETIELQDFTPLAVPDVETDAAPAVFNAISLPNLSRLTFNNACLSIVHLILSHVSAPNLDRLAVHANNAPLNLDWSVIRRDTLAEVKSFAWSSWAEPTDAHGLRIAAFYRAIVSCLVTVQEVWMNGAMAVRDILPAPPSATTEDAVLPRMTRLECNGLKGCELDLLVSLLSARACRGLPRMEQLSFSARDFSTTASVGQRAMEAVDDAMDSLKGMTGSLDVRDRQDGQGFRYTFLGWRDYRAHQSRGRQWEYEEEYEE